MTYDNKDIDAYSYMAYLLFMYAPNITLYPL